MLTACIQKFGSGETMTIRLDCEWTLLHVSSALNILEISCMEILAIDRYETLYSLREIHQCLGKTNLPKDSITRDSSLFRSVEQDMGLFFSIFIVSRYWATGMQRWIVYCEIKEIWRNSAHDELITRIR
jgi:hypothetical protein